MYHSVVTHVASIQRVCEGFRARHIKGHALSLHQQVLQSLEIRLWWGSVTPVKVSILSEPTLSMSTYLRTAVAGNVS